VKTPFHLIVEPAMRFSGPAMMSRISPRSFPHAVRKRAALSAPTIKDALSSVKISAVYSAH
jgi:hypothetical protein